MIIAIDGEPASGKGSISKIISDKLSLKYLDTGLLYRGLAYIVNNKVAININDSRVLAKLASNLDLENIPLLELKTDKIAQLASHIAQQEEVRIALNKYQVNFINKYKHEGVLLDGRDIGTVICPEADFKFYICSTLEIRAQRRYEELKVSNSKITFKEIKQSLLERDTRDKNRAISALKKAEDAIEIDTSYLTIEEAVDKILMYVGQSKHKI